MPVLPRSGHSIFHTFRGSREWAGLNVICLPPAPSRCTVRQPSADNPHREASASIEARDFLSHPDDNLAFCTSSFEVSHSLVGRLEWKDPIHNWPNNPRIDEATDLA